jgi:hypothetical protein
MVEPTSTSFNIDDTIKQIILGSSWKWNNNLNSIFTFKSDGTFITKHWPGKWTIQENTFVFVTPNTMYTLTSISADKKCFIFVGHARGDYEGWSDQRMYQL